MRNEIRFAERVDPRDAPRYKCEYTFAQVECYEKLTCRCLRY